MIWSVALVVGMIWLAFRLARSETRRSRGDDAGYVDTADGHHDHDSVGHDGGGDGGGNGGGGD